MTKLSLVAAGCGVTTVPADLVAVLPDGVRLVRVEGGLPELRRVVLAWLPGRGSPGADAVAAAFTG